MTASKPKATIETFAAPIQDWIKSIAEKMDGYHTMGTMEDRLSYLCDAANAARVAGTNGGRWYLRNFGDTQAGRDAFSEWQAREEYYATDLCQTYRLIGNWDESFMLRVYAHYFLAAENG